MTKTYVMHTLNFQLVVHLPSGCHNPVLMLSPHDETLNVLQGIVGSFKER